MAWSLWLEIAEAASIDGDEGEIVSGRVAEVIDKIGNPLNPRVTSG